MQNKPYPLNGITDADNLKEMFAVMADKYADCIAFKYAERGAAVQKTYAEFTADVEAAGIDPATITEGQRLVADLGLSSLDVFSLTVQFEDAFNIEIPDRHIMRFVTVGDIVTYLNGEAVSGR